MIWYNIYKNTVQDTALKTFAVLFIGIKIYLKFGSIIFSALWHHFRSTASVCVCFVIYNIHVIICTVLLRHLVSQNHVDKLHLLIEQPEQAAHQTWPRLDDVAQVAGVGGLRHISWHHHMTQDNLIVMPWHLHLRRRLVVISVVVIIVRAAEM